MFRLAIVLGFLTLNATAIEGASAEETVRFNSAGTPPTAFQIKRAKAKGVEPKGRPGDEITGTLRIPAGDTPAPAVAMLHSCRGVLPYLQDWAEFLTDEGFVTLVVDSYSTRGKTGECDEGVIESGVPQSSDAYGALQYLATVDAVDGGRIGLLGWGQSPILGAMELDGTERFYEQKFTAAVGIYIGCSYFTEGMVYAPTLLLIAGKDDWSLQGRCAKMVKAGQQNGSPISMVEYPDALHGFDDPSAGKETRLAIRNLYKNPALGATIGYNSEVHADAKEHVKMFFSQNLSVK